MLWFGLVEHIEKLEKRITQLECSHEKFIFNKIIWYDFQVSYEKRCATCAKVLRTLTTEEYNKEEAQQLRERAEKLDPSKPKKRGART